MPSETAYAWTWLPGETEPVVCGRIDAYGGEIRFTHGSSYLRRLDASPLAPAGLGPLLAAGQQRPPTGLDVHGVIRDAAPDSWGMRVLLRRLVGIDALDVDELSLIRYLLESGSNRIGALDFQVSASEYEPRDTQGRLVEIVEAGDRLARGETFSPELDEALTYGSAVGGARPKAIVVDDTGPRRELIAKFSVSTDTFPWMQAEAIGMELSRRCGLAAAATALPTAAGRDVLLVDRFDRSAVGGRLGVLSGLTLLGLHELAGARHGSYVDLVDVIATSFEHPDATLAELFARLVVNILIGNTDDHPRNVAALWDGTTLRLSPAYDMCPQPRPTGETAQAMAFGPDGQRDARLDACIDAAWIYRLSRRDAAALVDRCVAVVCGQFDEVCATVGASDATHDLLWQRAVANPSVFYESD
jgi:serine/threonine-protein kinase HipA